MTYNSGFRNLKKNYPYSNRIPIAYEIMEKIHQKVPNDYTILATEDFISVKKINTLMC